MTIPKLTFSSPSGPSDAPLLLLSSVVGTGRALWIGASKILSERFRVVHWDLPGHGSSPAASDPFSLKEVADAVAARIGEEHDGPVFFAGASMGGAVGLELLLRHPGSVTAAAIMCSGAQIGTPELWRARAEQVRKNGSSTLEAGAAERWFAPDSITRIPSVCASLLAELRDVDDESYALCCDALADYDVRGNLGAIATPVLAVYGEHDFLTPEENSNLIAAGVQDGRCAVIADAGHVAPAEQASAVATMLAEFFDSPLEQRL